MNETNTTKQYAVYADYFKTGNQYLISKTWTLEMAHLIAHRAEANLTEPEREVFGYTIKKLA